MSIYFKKCKQCDETFKPKKSKQKFCSKKCHAKHQSEDPNHSATQIILKKILNNSYGIISQRELTGLKKSVGAKKPHKWIGSFNYSLVYFRKCKAENCDNMWTIKENYKEKYCGEHKHLHWRCHYRQKYDFIFHLWNYPDLFNLNKIIEIGMYDARENRNGLTRDHKVSIHESIKNNYDPYYITHPLNCEILTMSENAKKHTSSSISYNELVKMVDEYDNQISLPSIRA